MDERIRLGPTMVETKMEKSEGKKHRLYMLRYSCLRRALGCRQFAGVSVEASCSMGVGVEWVARMWH